MHLLWKHYFQSHLENGASQEEWREGAKEKDGRWSDGLSADEKHQGECLWQDEEGDKKMKDQPTAGQVAIGVQSSVGKRRFSRTSAQCPHVGAFRSSFYIFFIFWAEVPPLLNGGILKRLPNTLENTNVFAGNNVKAWEQTYLPIVAHSAVTSTSLNKSNGKRLCRKISLLRNKCDAMRAKSYGAI